MHAFTSSGRAAEERVFLTRDESQLGDKRDLYNGFGDALARAFEFVGTPAVFGLFGWLLDRRLGIVPVLTITFAVLVLVYEFWKMGSRYTAQMKVHEARRQGTRLGPEGSQR